MQSVRPKLLAWIQEFWRLRLICDPGFRRLLCQFLLDILSLLPQLQARNFEDLFSCTCVAVTEVIINIFIIFNLASDIFKSWLTQNSVVVLFVVHRFKTLFLNFNLVNRSSGALWPMSSFWHSQFAYIGVWHWLLYGLFNILYVYEINLLFIHTFPMRLLIQEIDWLIDHIEFILSCLSEFGQLLCLVLIGKHGVVLERECHRLIQFRVVLHAHSVLIELNHFATFSHLLVGFGVIQITRWKKLNWLFVCQLTRSDLWQL